MSDTAIIIIATNADVTTVENRIQKTNNSSVFYYNKSHAPSVQKNVAMISNV